MGIKKFIQKFDGENLLENRQFKDQLEDERITLKWILGKYVVRM
jgi:hypothetical protein